MNNKLNKINLSGPTVSPNTYAGLWSGKYVAAALLSGETLSKELITLHPNVAYKEVIRNWQNSVSIDSATCDYTDNSSITLGEYVLTTVEKQVNMTLCKNNLRTTWEAAQAGFSAFEKLPATFEEFLLAQVAAEVAQGVELGIWKTNTFYTGGMVQYLIDNSAIVSAGSGATSGSNVVARLQSMLDASPAALYGKEGYQFYVGPLTMKAYQAALSAGNYNFQFYVGEKPMNFQGIPVTMCPGLNDSDCVLGLKSDLHFGTGLLSDYNEVKVIDMADIDGSQNVRTIMRFTGGIIATNPTQQVVLNIT
tara:strand:+ start:495 stop:1415 length:921 start_codon:yes stop_codon:yes gene_type:complete